VQGFVQLDIAQLTYYGRQLQLSQDTASI